MKKLGLQEVEKFLAAHSGQVENVAIVGKGQWSQAFYFHRDETDYVIRFAPSAEAYKKDQIVSGFSSTDLPVPKILEIGKHFDGYFAISERVFGEVLDELDTERFKKIIPAFFKMLDTVRTADINAFSGFGYWDGSGKAPFASWHDFLLDVKNDLPGNKIFGWRESMQSSPFGAGPFDKAYARLESLINRIDTHSQPRHLVHTDLLYYNVLVSGDRISAVLDWGNALFGDFLYDLANFTFWAPWYPAMHGIDWTALAGEHYAQIGLNLPDFERRLRCCELHIGLAGMAWNAFKKNWTEMEATMKRISELI